MTIRVLIADDQVMIRDGLAALLTSAPDIEVVGQAGDGQEAVAMARELRPDVIVMDIRMPTMDGLAATEKIVGGAAADGAPDEAPKVLVLTTFDLDEYVYEALGAGASGFLLKDASAADLIAGVRIVAAGDALLAPSITRRLISDFARRRRHERPRPDALAALTPREIDVLRLIARPGPRHPRGPQLWNGRRRSSRRVPPAGLRRRRAGLPRHGRPIGRQTAAAASRLVGRGGDGQSAR
jgi:DNA-binding NarL/FixJ family response regulator